VNDTYEDFEVQVLPGQGDLHFVQVRCTQGDASSQVKFEIATSAPRLQQVSRAVARSGRDLAGPLTSPGPTDRDIVSFGTELFDTLLPKTLRDLYMSTRAVARDRKIGLRVRLRIEVPALALLPWELLYCDDDFLCLSEQTPVVRHPSVSKPIVPLETKLPLKILAVLSNPPSKPLNVQEEQQRVSEALAPLIQARKVELRWVDGQTPLQEALDEFQPNILHFAGHGAAGEGSGEGQIFLQNAAGEPVPFGAQYLALLLKDSPSVRVVFLNSCEGAKETPNAFSSTASRLVASGIPCVLAMQFEISDEAAVEFSAALYRELAAGRPVDAAVSEARRALKLRKSFEWSTPVLYLRSRESKLFSLKAGNDARKLAFAIGATLLSGGALAAAASRWPPVPPAIPSATSSLLPIAKSAPSEIPSAQPPAPFDWAKWFAQPCTSDMTPPADANAGSPAVAFRAELCRAKTLLEEQQPCAALERLVKLTVPAEANATAAPALAKLKAAAEAARPVLELKMASQPDGLKLTLEAVKCADGTCAKQDVTSQVGQKLAVCAGSWVLEAKAPTMLDTIRPVTLRTGADTQSIDVVFQPRATTGKLVVFTSQGATPPQALLIDGAYQDAVSGTFILSTGSHQVVATWPDGTKVTKYGTVSAGGTASIALKVRCKESGTCTNWEP
jgi:hypothetical protein